jgi:hypothetical protein
MKIEFKEEEGRIAIAVMNKNSLYHITFEDKEAFLQAILTGHAKVWQAHFVEKKKDEPST